MSKQKTVKSNEKIETTTTDKLLTIADVARELKLDPKRARAFMRRNVELYTMRKTKFNRASDAFKRAFDALTTYKKSLSSPKPNDAIAA